GWQVTQLRAAGEHASALSLELGRTAAALRSWANDAAADPELSGTMLAASDAAGLRDLYARVRASGFNADELGQFHALGYTDARIAAIRTHASADVGAIPVDTSYPTALRAV